MSIYVLDEQTDEVLIHGFKKDKSIILENVSSKPFAVRLFVEMDTEAFDDYYSELFELAADVWGYIEPKEATTFGNDYREYYDKELDNNGEAAIGEQGIYFFPPAPHLKYKRLYRFTKRKMESYLYDLKKYTSFQDGFIR